MSYKKYYIVEEYDVFDGNYILGMAYFLIQCFEGFKSTLSINPADGGYDIGYGFTWINHGKHLQNIYVFDGKISIESANNYLYKLVAAEYNHLQKLMSIHKFSLSAGEQIACISLIYAVGENGFEKGSGSCFISKNKAALSDSFVRVRRYQTAKGIVQKGMVRRRGLEKQIFDAPDNILDSVVRRIIIANTPKRRK